MAHFRLAALALAGTCLLTPAARAGAPDPLKVAARIDELVGANWDKAGVRPAAPANDATFFRRVSLDLVGRIPPPMEVRRFLSDRAPDKRARAVERLLDTPGYANNFTNVWRDLLLPEALTDPNRRYLTPSMERWLHKQFSANVPYDKMVRELITLPVTSSIDVRFRYFGGDVQATPFTFYLAKEGKPEELAAATARLFMGVRLECAQCHDHPFGKWKRDEFWGHAAFFAGIRPVRDGDFFGGQLKEVADRRELAIPNTERVAQARFLDGKEPRWKYKVGARTTLADWLTAKDNPFFARTIVNRMWAHFFGIGLVDPVDDFSDCNPPSHPELLDELARQFVASGHDLKWLVRAITLSKAYQLASAYDGPPPEPRLFARMPLRVLTGEQLYDSVLVATGLTGARRQPYFAFGSSRQDFLDKFRAPERRTEYQASISQALTLMNGSLLAEATNPKRGPVLGAIAEATFMSTTGKVEALFLAALSRKPRSEELGRLAAYVERGGPRGDRKQALGDVFWALLNSTEFILNH
jgi:hypothetical protein